MNMNVCIMDIDVKNILNLFCIGESLSYDRIGSLANMPNPIRNEDSDSMIIYRDSLW